MAKPINDLTADRVKTLLEYDPERGSFIRKKRVYAGHDSINGKRNNESVGNFHATTGYVRIWILGRLYLAHRLAWLIQTGSWPIYQIDHINGKRTDNRFCNLREATNQQNGQNKKKLSKCLKGAHINIRTGKFAAHIGVNGKQKYIGIFDTEKEAHEAYQKASKKIYGDFARFE